MQFDSLECKMNVKFAYSYLYSTYILFSAFTFIVLFFVLCTPSIVRVRRFVASTRNSELRRQVIGRPQISYDQMQRIYNQLEHHKSNLSTIFTINLSIILISRCGE